MVACFAFLCAAPLFYVVILFMILHFVLLGTADL